MIMNTLRCMSLFLCVVFASDLVAQCTKDTDCRDPRICVNGTCTDPSGKSQPTVAKTKKHPFVCFWAEGATAEDLIPGVADDAMSVRLQKIGSIALLRDLPSVLTGPVRTAAPKIDEDSQPPRRLILFNPEYMKQLSTSGGDLAITFVIAHELGHHVNADVWIGDRARRHQYEFAADAFAARVMARLRATEQQTTAAISTLPDSEDDDHPAAGDRRTKILEEYRSVNDALRKEEASRLCSPQQTWNGEKCADRCSTGTRWNGTSCVAACPPEQTLRNGACMDRCEPEERWDGDSCVERCPDGQQWDGKRCKPRCNSSQRWNGEKCVSKGLRAGTITQACGCWGPTAFDVTRRNNRCASGYDVIQGCAFMCPLGGYAWGARCTEPEDD